MWEWEHISSRDGHVSYHIMCIHKPTISICWTVGYKSITGQTENWVQDQSKIATKMLILVLQLKTGTPADNKIIP